MKRGDIWWATLPPPWGRRPVVLLARNEAYTLLTWVTVAPVTTHVRDIPTAVRLDPLLDGVPRMCAVSLDNIQAIRREWLDTQIGRLRPETLLAVDRAIHFALGLRNCPTSQRAFVNRKVDHLGGVLPVGQTRT